MKKHILYRWLRRMAIFSGIPALTMMFACDEHECLYGPPSDVIWGVILEKEYHPIPGVLVQDENGDSLTSTDDGGSYELLNVQNCKSLIFSKEGYYSKDTTLCPATDGSIYLKKIAENSPSSHP